MVCSVYIDDILIVSSTFEGHLERVREVLSRLRRAGLCLKPRKLRPKVHFLGYVVSKDGVYPDRAKTEKVKRFPTLTDVTSLK